MTVLGLLVFVWGLSPAAASGGHSSSRCAGPLTIAAPPAAGHRLQTRRLSSRGSRAQPLRGMWDPPRPGLEPVSPALAGRLPATAPPGKPSFVIFVNDEMHCLICRFFHFFHPSSLFPSLPPSFPRAAVCWISATPGKQTLPRQVPALKSLPL